MQDFLQDFFYLFRMILQDFLQNILVIFKNESFLSSPFLYIKIFYSRSALFSQVFHSFFHSFTYFPQVFHFFHRVFHSPKKFLFLKINFFCPINSPTSPQKNKQKKRTEFLPSSLHLYISIHL